MLFNSRMLYIFLCKLLITIILIIILHINYTVIFISTTSTMRNVNSEYFSRRELSIRLLFINTQSVFFNYDENWMNILSLMALRRNIRKAKNSAIFRDGNARVLTRNAFGHSARSADAHVYGRVEVCAFMWMRQTGT